MRLLVTGGGTGGHVYPLLAVLQSLAADRVLDPKRDVRYVGREGGIEQQLAAQEGIPFAALNVKGLRTGAPWSVVSGLALMVAAQTRCRMILNNFKPEVVLATGGYVSAPGIWAAARNHTPVVIYLPDLEPGWAIRVLSRWARKVAVSFDEVAQSFPSGKVVVTGYPVRAGFYEAAKTESREHFELDPSERVISIFGGSQGSHSINEAVRENLTQLIRIGQVLHITGPQDEAVLRGHKGTLDQVDGARYHIYGYLHMDMPKALAAADLVIARAGAATLGELPAVGVPAVLVPYPFAGRHQDKNANFLASQGAAVVIKDGNLARELIPTLNGLLLDETRLSKMKAAIQALARPDAARNIGALLTQAAA